MELIDKLIIIFLLILFALSILYIALQPIVKAIKQDCACTNVNYIERAMELKEIYVTPSGRCRICGKKIYNITDRTGYSILSKVYKHFKEEHPHLVDALGDT